MIRLIFRISLALMVVIVGRTEVHGELEPVAEFRLIRPDVLATRVNQLFAGTKTPHPASALSAWKRATRGIGSLGKPLEAVISFFNPEMAREWGLFDGTTLKFWSTKGPGATRLDWSLAVPHDDGTVEALLLAGILTEGARTEELPDHPGIPIDRLGPGGSPVAARFAGQQLIAGSPEALSLAIREVEASRGGAPKSDLPGIRFKLDGDLLAAVGQSQSEFDRTLAALSRVLQGRRIEGFSTLEKDELSIQFRSIGGEPGPAPLLYARPIDPAWLRGIAADQAVAVTCCRFDPSPSTWNTLFGLLDRIEKADPTKARTMPVRMRLNLLLGVAKVQPEVDLWPNLLGITLCLLDDQISRGATLAIHLESEAAARRIREQVVPRVAATYLARTTPRSPQPGADFPEVGDGSSAEKLGELLGKPIRVARSDQTVFLLWGEAALGSRGKPAEGRIEVSLVSDPRIPNPGRISLVWPGRLMLRPLELEPDSSAGRVFREARPAIWYGGVNFDRTQIEDLIVWKDLGRLVRRFLEAIPLDPADR